MRVVLVVCVFPPETGVSGTCAHDLAVELVRRGHEVTVITGRPCRPVGRYTRRARREYPRQSVDPAGFALLRVGALCAPGQTMAQKLVENLSFGAASAVRTALMRADIVFANTWPIFAQGMLSLACRTLGVPLVLNIQDIHPEAACGTGKLATAGWVAQSLIALDGMVARSATKIVTISEGFAEHFRKTRSVSAERLHVTPNWGDGERVTPRPRVGAVRAQWGLSDEAFVCLFAGNVGEVAGVETIVETASLLRGMPEVQFVIAGDGSQREACELQAHSLGVRNIRFHYPLGDAEFCDVQGAADLLLLPTRQAAALTSVPSKLISYMLSQRPVLAAVDSASETARVVRVAACGACVSPENPQAMADEVARLCQQREALAEMGCRARSYAQEHFDRDACVDRLCRLLETTSRRRGSVKALHAEAA